MIYASAESLSTTLTPEEREKGWLYPEVARIRDVSVIVARGVIRAAQASHVDRELPLRNLSDEQLDEYIRERMYDPKLEKLLVQEELVHLVKGMQNSEHKL